MRYQDVDLPVEVIKSYVGKRVLVLHYGFVYSTYKSLANRLGYPDAAIDLNNDVFRNPAKPVLAEKEYCTILAYGVHPLNHISLFVVEQNGYQYIIAWYGLLLCNQQALSLLSNPEHQSESEDDITFLSKRLDILVD